jgi:ribosomal protein S18 acetylase RimI-like enzyme
MAEQDLKLELRPMTEPEFTAFRAELIGSYAGDKVQAGEWAAQDAAASAAREVDGLLPDGVGTPGMLLLTAQTAARDVVGSVWVALRGDNAGSAWIYDIVIGPQWRGQGYGRALLAAAEREAARHGAQMIALNVFGANTVARGLYEASGYEITALQMRKELAPDAGTADPAP